MAIYVQGVPTYQREPKMFTPDYEYMQIMLSQRENKFNTNFKQLNNLYNEVLFSDMLRPELKAARDKFAEQLPKQIEKISGLDLSLQQNVDAARGVFQPFLENEMVAADMVAAKVWKKEMQKMEGFKNSHDQNVRNNYWQQGAKHLENWMEDYMSADLSQIKNFKLPKYVPNVDIQRLVEEYLKDFNIDATFEGFSDDGHYKIKYKNGKVVEDQVYRMVEQKLSSDPRVLDAYKVNYSVRAREFAKQAIAEGQVGSLDEGLNLWGKSVMQQVRDSSSQQAQVLRSQIANLKSQIKSEVNYLKRLGLPENSPQYQLVDQSREHLARLQRNLVEFNTTIADLEEALEDPDSQFYTAALYNSTRTSLMRDLNKAAQIYSEKNSSITYEEQKGWLNKQQHQFEMQELKYAQDRMDRRIQLQAQAQKDVLQFKQDLENQAENKRLTEAAQMAAEFQAALSGASAGEDINVDKVALNRESYTSGLSAITNSKIDLAMEYYRNGLDSGLKEGYNADYETGMVYKNRKYHVKINGVETVYTESQFRNEVERIMKWDGSGPKPKLATILGDHSEIMSRIEMNLNDASKSSKSGDYDSQLIANMTTQFNLIENGTESLRSISAEAGAYYERILENYFRLEDAKGAGNKIMDNLSNYYRGEDESLIYESIIKRNDLGQIIGVYSREEYIDRLSLKRGSKTVGKKAIGKAYDKQVEIINKAMDNQYPNVTKAIGSNLNFDFESAIITGDGYSSEGLSSDYRSRTAGYSFGNTQVSPVDRGLMINASQALNITGAKLSFTAIDATGRTLKESFPEDQLSEIIKTNIFTPYNQALLQEPDAEKTVTITYIPGGKGEKGKGSTNSKYIISSNHGENYKSVQATIEVPPDLDPGFTSRTNRVENLGAYILDEKIEVEGGGEAHIVKNSDGTYNINLTRYGVRNGNIFKEEKNGAYTTWYNFADGQPIKEDDVIEAIGNLRYDLIQLRKQNEEAAAQYGINR